MTPFCEFDLLSKEALFGFNKLMIGGCCQEVRILLLAAFRA